VTREEAIKRLETCNECGDCLTCAAHDEALDMAISALREQEERNPCQLCEDMDTVQGGHTMKFKKDGKEFLRIEDVGADFCASRIGPRACDECPLGNAAGLLACGDWQQDHPAEAARLMGYEVVEEAVQVNDLYDEDGGDILPEKEANMDKQKPLKDWTLGELKEHCSIRLGHCDDCLFSQHTCMVSDKDCPHEWDLSENPRFTEEEVADARAIVRLFGPNAWTHIGKTEDGYPQLEDKDEETEIAIAYVWLAGDLFPSILPGTSVKLSDIVGGES